MATAETNQLKLGESASYAAVHSTAGVHNFPDTHKHTLDIPLPSTVVAPQTIGATASAQPVASATAPIPVPTAGQVAVQPLSIDTVDIPVYIMNKEKTLAGVITAKDTIYGLMLKPNLSGLSGEMTPGVHGFHIHEKKSCDDMGMAAGGHLDPAGTKAHLGPFNPQGHLGDLPAVYIDKDGNLSIPVVAPRLKVSDILGKSIMIHGGGDNYSDEPEALGGGGSRMICGVIPEKSGY